MNFRMSELQAALGHSQLNVSGSSNVRGNNFQAYKERLAGVKGCVSANLLIRAVNAYYCLTVILSGSKAGVRDELLARLPALGVGVSVHYPHPLPRLAYYREKYGYTCGTTRSRLAIPPSTYRWGHVDADDVDYICTNLFHCLRN